jgi:AAA family ATP:ADP antiporter
MGPPYLTFTTGYLFRPNFAAAAGAALMALRSVKIAENSTDYSVMDTAKQMIWLPTSREEKHEAKRAIDTFYVRAGD